MLRESSTHRTAGRSNTGNHSRRCSRGSDGLLGTNSFFHRTINMTDEEERATDARLEAAADRAPPHSVHRMVRSDHFFAMYRRKMHAKAPPPIPHGKPATSPTNTAVPRFLPANANNTRRNPTQPEMRMIGTSFFSILILVCFITRLRRPNDKRTDWLAAQAADRYKYQSDPEPSQRENPTAGSQFGRANGSTN